MSRRRRRRDRRKTIDPSPIRFGSDKFLDAVDYCITPPVLPFVDRSDDLTWKEKLLNDPRIICGSGTGIRFSVPWWWGFRVSDNDPIYERERELGELPDDGYKLDEAADMGCFDDEEI